MLKIIYLNTWFAKAEKPFFDFVREQMTTTDVFCFMEISNCEKDIDFGNFSNEKAVVEKYKDIVKPSSAILFRRLQEFLPGFMGEYAQSEVLKIPLGGIPLGICYFVKKDLEVKGQKVTKINDATEIPNCFERNMQSFEVQKNGRTFTINSLHGLSQPGNKLDTEERLTQSRNICAVLEKQEGPKILGGDFNLMPETESIKMIERSGMRNLIKEFEVDETRGEINHSQYPDKKQHFADFAFVSEGVLVKSFEVPKIEISDHLPLILEVE